MVDIPKIPQFDDVEWHYNDEDDQWHLRDGHDLIGEVYLRDEGVWVWHCKTSDWKGTRATAEHAKAECLISHVRGLMLTWSDQRVAALTTRHGAPATDPVPHETKVRP